MATLEELQHAQRYWASFWMPVVGVALVAGVGIGIGLARLFPI